MIVGGILLLATLKEGLGFCPVLLSFRAIHNRGMTRRRERRMSDSRRDSASRYQSGIVEVTLIVPLFCFVPVILFM